MRTDILLVTYRKDYDFAVLCIRSISKFAKDFGGVSIVCPVEDETLFSPLASHYRRNDLPIEVKSYIPKKEYEFNHHQVIKCYADVFCPSAAFILHIDSDCIFTDEVTPADYFTDGKPQLLIRSYKTSDPCYIWKAPTSKALMMDCEFETMARHPAIHHCNSYKELRNYMEFKHGIPFSEWVLKQPSNYPMCHFSEFNTLGSYVIAYAPERYSIINLDKQDAPANKMIQGWSWGGVEQSKNEYEKILSR